MSNDIKPKINDQFWFDYSEKLINESHTNADKAAEKLQNLILWLWGIYTTYCVVGSSLQESQYSFWMTFLIVLSSVFLILVYGGTVWIQIPVKTSFDPRSPDDIKEAYKIILLNKIFRFKITFFFVVISIIMVSLSLVLISIIPKNNNDIHKVLISEDIHKPENNIEYVFSKQLDPIYIYFDKGLILQKENDSLVNLENIFTQKINKNNKYIIKITGFSSTEVVSLKNTLADNYQISMARANNVKKYILDIVDKYHFSRENFVIDIFAFSNQDIPKMITNDHKENRKVKIEIIELIENITN
jgi:hypothetical protein